MALISQPRQAAPSRPLFHRLCRAPKDRFGSTGPASADGWSVGRLADGPGAPRQRWSGRGLPGAPEQVFVSVDCGLAFELEAKLAKERNCRRKVLDGNANVVHPSNRHMANLTARPELAPHEYFVGPTSRVREGSAPASRQRDARKTCSTSADHVAGSRGGGRCSRGRWSRTCRTAGERTPL